MKQSTKRLLAFALAFVLIFFNIPNTVWGYAGENGDTEGLEGYPSFVLKTSSPPSLQFYIPIQPFITQTANSFAELQAHLNNTSVTGAQIHLTSGVIENNVNGGVAITGGTTLNMHDGALIRFNGLTGAGMRTGRVDIRARGTFNMFGGLITGNQATSGNAGGVTVSSLTFPSTPGRFTMHGGQITNNTAPNGGGLLTSATNAAANNIVIHNAAEFSGNNATNGLTVRDDLVWRKKALATQRIHTETFSWSILIHKDFVRF